MADPLASIKQAEKEFLRDARAALVQAADRAAETLLAEMKRLTLRMDHDLNALRRLGYPYGKGVDRFGNPREPGRPHPDWLVHLQSGELQDGLRRVPASLRRNRVEAEIHSQAKHTWYLLLGTRLMRPRDFVSAAIINQEQNVQAIFERAFFALHDQVVGQLTPLDVTLIPHDDEAQLPERG